MADETCYELDCCPLGIGVTPIGGILSLTGDDSTGTDPNIADNEPLLLQEGYQVRAFTQAGQATIQLVGTPGTLVAVGQNVVVIGIYKTATLLSGSPVFTATNVAGLTNNLYIISPFFPPDAYIVSIVGTTVTMSQNSSGTGVSEVFFYGSSATLPATIIPTGTTVTNVTGGGAVVTLSSPATTSVTRLLLDFSPATIDPNLADKDEIYT